MNDEARISPGQANTEPTKLDSGSSTGAQSPAMDGDYLATVYHGLLQSIQSISGYFELLLDGKVPDPNQRAHFLAIAYREAQYLVNRIGDLMITDAIQKGDLELHREPVSPSTLVASALRKFRPKAAYKGVQIETTLNDLPEMDLDPELVTKALLVLLDAQIKFAPRQAKLHVGAEDRGTEVEFQIREASGALSKDILSELSTGHGEAGETAHATSGLGIGLANVKYIIEAHDGRIWFKSLTEGGSAFHFTLPTEGTSRQLSRSQASVPRILIVDDEPAPLEMMDYALAHEGYETFQALNGIEALEIAQREAVDLIVLDVMLPGIDGYEVCHRLRSDLETEKIPVLMISAKAKDQDKATALRVGAQAYFKKPFSMSDLIAGVDRLLADSKRAERSDVDGIPIIDA
jgi:two-component system sensor histidine kinase ChiS